VIGLRLFFLISVRNDKVNIFLFALLEFNEVGLFGFDEVENGAIFDFK
jgi:hypothetical protein